MQHLEQAGCVRGRVDRCVIYMYDDGRLVGSACIHVDDGTGYAEESTVDWFEQVLSSRFDVKFKRVPRGQADEFTGLEIHETDEGVRISQFQYIEKKLAPVPLSQKRSRQQQAPITEEERSDARSCAGALRWVHRTVMEPGYELNRLSSWIGSDNCTVAQIIRLNKVVNYIKRGRRPHDAPPEAAVQSSLFLPRLDMETTIKVVMVCDAGDPKDDGQYRGKWQGSVCIGICNDYDCGMSNWQGEDVDPFGCVYWKMSLTRRTCNSSYDGESNVFVEGLDVGLSVQELAEEYEFGVRPSLWERHITRHMAEEPEGIVPIEGHTDSNDLVTASRSLVYAKGMQKRRKGDVADIQQLQELGRLRELVKIKGISNPMDAGTKTMTFESQTMSRLRSLQNGWYTPDCG